jgi:hypothetical protein
MDEERVRNLHPRAAKQRLAHAKDYLAHLELARRSKQQLDGESTIVDQEIAAATITVMRLSGRSGERIEQRRRVPIRDWSEDSAPRPEYLLFLDECGSHPLTPSSEKFPVFCLCGVIIDAERYRYVDRLWKTWKANWLGSARELVHEPDVRRRSHRFHNSDPVREQALIDSLSVELAAIDFTCIAAVIDKRHFADMHPEGFVDDFLPASGYLMCIDFVIERFVHFLHHVGGDARGLVVAESRGAREDAEVHSEFIRLQLDGTQWQSEAWFRHQLRPYIEFQKKRRNSSGLQLADLCARPIAEKVLNPTSNPERWETIRPKFYDGTQGRPTSYGLKIYPTPVDDNLFS